MSRPPDGQPLSEQRCDRGQPLDVDQRDVINRNGSMYINITSLASRVLSISEGETMDVKTFQDQYVISKTDD